MATLASRWWIPARRCWLAVSATTVAATDGVNRTSPPSTVTRPACSARRISRSASRRPASRSCASVGRVASAATSSVSRTPSGRP
ncbi:hypothetical protein ACFQX7_30300 [Luedemannella flava]